MRIQASLMWQNVALAVVVLGAVMQLGARAVSVGDTLTRFFDDNRVTKCPAPGEEHAYEDKVTIKVLNTPKERCQELCASKGLESIRYAEQVAYGPKLICCCKPSEASGGQ